MSYKVYASEAYVKEETSAKINELKASGGIGHVESKLVEIFGEMETNSDGEYVITAIPKEGDEVTFYIDGVAHVRTAKVGVLGDYNAVYIGNGAEFGLSATDDNFCLCMVDAGIGITFYTIFADGGTHTVSCYAKTETIHTIDPKFLPNGVEKTILYEGTPQKFDTFASLMGTLYIIGTENLLPFAEGQNIYFEYTSNGETVKGCMDYIPYNGVNENGEIIFMYSRTMDSSTLVTAIQYNPELGGLGFGEMKGSKGIDLGDISLKLWTEYNPYGVYKIVATDSIKAANINSEKIYQHSKTGSFCLALQNKLLPANVMLADGSNEIEITALVSGDSDSWSFYKFTFVDGILEAK